MKPRHETHDHIVGKQRLAAFWESRGYACLFEEVRADVVAYSVVDNRLRIIANEYERSARNLIKNVRRDFGGGCHALLVAVPNENLRSAIRRKLRRELPRHLWTKVSVVLLARIISLTPSH